MGIRRSRGTGWRYWKALFKTLTGGFSLLEFHSDVTLDRKKAMADDASTIVVYIIIAIIGIIGFPIYKLSEHWGFDSTYCYVIAGATAIILLLFSGRIFMWATEKDEEREESGFGSFSYKTLAFLPALFPLFVFAIGGTELLSAFVMFAVPALCLFAVWFHRKIKLTIAIAAIVALAAIGISHFATYKVLGRKPTMVKTELLGITLPDYNESKGCLLLLAGKKEGYEPLFKSLMANGDSASALRLSIEAIGNTTKDTAIINLCIKQLSALVNGTVHTAAAKAALEKAYASDKENPILIRHHIEAMQEKGDTAATIEALERGIASAKQQSDKNATLKYNMMLGDIYMAQGYTERYMATLREVVATGYYDAATFAAYYDLITSNGKNLKKGWSECSEAIVENSIYGKQQASPIYILAKAKIRFMEKKYIGAEYYARLGMELVSEPDTWLLEFLGDVNLKLAEYLKQNRNIPTGKSPYYYRKQAANYYEKAIEKSSTISNEALYEKLKAATK